MSCVQGCHSKEHSPESKGHDHRRDLLANIAATHKQHGSDDCVFLFFFYSSFHVRNAINSGEACHSQLTDTWCPAPQSRPFRRQSSLWRLPSWLRFWQDAGEQAKTQRSGSNLHPAGLKVPQNTLGLLAPLTRSRLNLSLGGSRQMTWYWCLPS